MPRTRDEASHPRASTRTRELLYLLLQFLVFLAIYTLFSAGSFYKADGQQLLLQMRAGTYDWPYHPLYLPLFYGFRSLIDACGGASLTLFEKAEALSACTASLGLVFCYLAFLRLGLTAAKARFGTWILGLIPCVVLFSTVVEVHAPFFCFAALSFLAFAQFDRRPTLFYAILLGLSTAFATGFHATGLLWPSALLPLFLVRRWKLCLANERWAILGLATIAGATHLLLHYGFAALWQSLDWLSDPEASAQLVAKGFSKERGLAYLPLVFYREFLLGLLPLSLFPLLLPFARERKKELLALVPALVLYLLLCSYLIASEPEFGAYLLPLAIPIAWLSARVLRPSLLVILLLSAALLSYTLVPRSGLGDEVAYRSFAESGQTEARGCPGALFACCLLP